MKSTSWSSKPFGVAVLSAVVAAILFLRNTVHLSTPGSHFEKGNLLDRDDNHGNDGFLHLDGWLVPPPRSNVIINRHSSHDRSSSSLFYWSPNCPSSSNLLGTSDNNIVDSEAACCCSITDYGVSKLMSIRI